MMVDIDQIILEISQASGYNSICEIIQSHAPMVSVIGNWPHEKIIQLCYHIENTNITSGVLSADVIDQVRLVADNARDNIPAPHN